MSIVANDAPHAIDRSQDREVEIVPNFGDGHDMSHAGRIDNAVTINGRVSDAVSVRSGERLRLINVANARNFALRFEEHDPVIIAIEGQPLEPHEPAGGTIVLAAAMRVDEILGCTQSPESETRVIDVFYPDQAFALMSLRFGPEPATRHELMLAGGAPLLTPSGRKWGNWWRRGVFWAMGGTPGLPVERPSGHRRGVPSFVRARGYAPSSRINSILGRNTSSQTCSVTTPTWRYRMTPRSSRRKVSGAP